MIALVGPVLRDVGHAAAPATSMRSMSQDGQGDEPAKRGSAYLSVLWQIGDDAEVQQIIADGPAL
ncbi:hypothetical protein GCM10009836_49780 [Pseudonocardia ailaonensis]|uniref:Uncharacterized protein n=1 Tax=Pseudonocardia ailaonensis TaxID=367279 RepID=A0ABN2NG36_9PSEU